MRRGDPGGNCVARLLGDLKLDRPLRFLLHDDRAGRAPATLDHIVNAESNQIATAQLAVDGEVEQGDLAGIAGHLQTGADGVLVSG